MTQFVYPPLYTAPPTLPDGLHTYIDLTLLDVNLKGFNDISNDGVDVYLTGGYDGTNSYSKLVKIPNPTDPSNYKYENAEVYDFPTITGQTFTNLSSGTNPHDDNGYIYVLGGSATGAKALKVDKTNITLSGITEIDLGGLPGGFSRTQVAEGYCYFLPADRDTATIARVPLTNYTLAAVETIDLTAINSEFCGFDRMSHDATHVYLSPYYNNALTFNVGHVLRIAHADFTPTGVESVNIKSLNSLCTSFLHIGVGTSYVFGTAYYGSNATQPYFWRINKSNFTTGGTDIANLGTVGKGYYGLKYYGGYLYPMPAAGASSGLGNGSYISRFSENEWPPTTINSDFDLSLVNSDLTGWPDGTFLNGYMYLCPWYNNPGRSGYLPRIDVANMTRSNNPTYF